MLLSFLLAGLASHAQATRQVMQTVFTPEGTPAAGARVHASFCRQNLVQIVDTVADAKGIVTWKALPPGRVIVWGNNVPPGILPADVTAVTTPLPPLQLPEEHGDEEQACQFIIGNPGDVPATFRWVHRNRDDMHDVAPYQPGQDGAPSLLVQSSEWREYNGAVHPFSLLVYTDSEPPRWAGVENIYLPFRDAPGPMRYQLSLREGATVRGQLVAAGGAPVPGVSRLGILPISPRGSFPFQGSGRMLSAPANPVLIERENGAFTFSALLPGDYRLLLDLYDASTTPPPQLLLHLEPGIHEVTVKLPPLLLTLPAGTEVCWLTNNAPADTRRLRVAAFGGGFPVYGPAGELLAVWYQLSPNRLEFRQPASGAAPRVLTLRSVMAPFKVKGDYPFGEDEYTLQALLPRQRREWGFWNGDTLFGRADSAVTIMPRLPRLLWTADYLISDINADIPLGVAAVPAQGEPVITDLPVNGNRQTSSIVPPKPAGVTVSGTLLDPWGKPPAKTPVRVWDVPVNWNDGNESKQTTTDAQGHFSVAGIAPGWHFVMIDGTPDARWWSIRVPAGGLANVILRAVPESVQVDLPATRTAGPFTTWWFPDDGAPMPIFAACQHMTPGDGWVWSIDREGLGNAMRFTTAPGRYYALDDLPGGALGITFPLTADALMPGALTLTGQGKRDGFQQTFTGQWFPSTLLGKVVTQLDAVPPGEYRLTIETPRGNVEAPVTVGPYGGAANLTFPLGP